MPPGGFWDASWIQQNELISRPMTRKMAISLSESRKLKIPQNLTFARVLLWDSEPSVVHFQFMFELTWPNQVTDPPRYASNHFHGDEAIIDDIPLLYARLRFPRGVGMYARRITVFGSIPFVIGPVCDSKYDSVARVPDSF